MHRNANQVVVRKGGFLSALAYGVFGTLTAVVVCATGLGIYALNMVDRRAENLLGVGQHIVTSLPELKSALPPAVADALNDRRDPAYQESVDLDVRLTSTEDARHAQLVIEATNNGPELLTLMAVRVVLLDENRVPVRAVSTYVATPATIDSDWRGPIMPGSTRRCAIPMFFSSTKLTPEFEVTDLRVWAGEAPTPELANAAD